jgi:outer membrane protein TolC
MARRALTAAEQLLKLSLERKQFEAAGVLERIQAEQELTRARLEYFNALAACNRAQFALRRSVGVVPEAK